MSEKLQKILARAGLGSRREIERWIEQGRVRVNDNVAKPGDRADSSAVIYVDGKRINIGNAPTSPLVLMYHKPIGEMCTRHDPEGRATVFDRLPTLVSGRWVMVGRLDYNTSGLLLFTNDGALAHQLMHPSSHIPRVYLVRIYGAADAAMLQRLQQGVELEDGWAKFDSIESTHKEGRNQWYQVSISMGKNRIVRRLWESQDRSVNRLIRIGFGHLQLPRTLAPGSYQLLTTEYRKLLI